MPIHNWARAPDGYFRHFHHQWCGSICNALNAGLLPKGFFAMIERREEEGSIQSDEDPCSVRADWVAVRDVRHQVVSIIEVASAENKSDQHALQRFTGKVADFVRQGVNVLTIDLFPPSSCNPQGIHKAIWDEIREEPFELPPDKPLTIAAYAVGPPVAAYVEPAAVGDILPEMPLFLLRDRYIPAPLEATYKATWDACPDEFKTAVAG